MSIETINILGKVESAEITLGMLLDVLSETRKARSSFDLYEEYKHQEGLIDSSLRQGISLREYADAKYDLLSTYIDKVKQAFK